MILNEELTDLVLSLGKENLTNLTKREYFACNAMKALIESNHTQMVKYPTTFSINSIIDASVDYADKLIMKLNGLSDEDPSDYEDDEPLTEEEQ
jgi:hypothetical protein